jgi:hypothetical protein
MKTNTGILSWVLLALLGLTSAILCVAPPSLGGWLDIFYVGTIYGVLLGVYFVACRGIRSAPKLATVVIVSAVAWPIAYFGSVEAAGHIPGGIVHRGDAVDPASPLIAFGGVLGGVVLLVPVLLLLKPSSLSWGAALLKAVLGILLSGIVGGVAWELGPTLGAAIWGLLPTAPLPGPESYGMAALFFVWQPVITLFIGWATSENRKAVPVQTGETQSEVKTPALQASGRLGSHAFAFILASLLALLLARIVPVRLRLAHRQHAAAKRERTQPSSNNLPQLTPLSERDALILNETADYVPGQAIHTIVPGKPPSTYFSVLYTRKGDPVPPLPQAPPRYITATVEEYPNAQWAQYLAEYPPRMYLSFDDTKEHALVSEFNNKIRSSQLTRAPGQTAIPLYYKWPSSNCVITIDYRTPDENLEIVRAYLEKYPSSIP